MFKKRKNQRSFCNLDQKSLCFLIFGTFDGSYMQYWMALWASLLCLRTIFFESSPSKPYLGWDTKTQSESWVNLFMRQSFSKSRLIDSKLRYYTFKAFKYGYHYTLSKFDQKSPYLDNHSFYFLQGKQYLLPLQILLKG